LASIMPDRSCAAPGVNEPEATQSSSEKLRLAGTRSEMQVLVMPECRALHGPCFRRPASRQRKALHRPNLQFDILQRVASVTDLRRQFRLYLWTGNPEQWSRELVGGFRRKLGY
jgi:hypothetical protein